MKKKPITFEESGVGLIHALLERDIKDLASVQNAIQTHLKNIKDQTVREKKLHPNLMRKITEVKERLMTIEKDLLRTFFNQD